MEAATRVCLQVILVLNLFATSSTLILHNDLTCAAELNNVASHCQFDNIFRDIKDMKQQINQIQTLQNEIDFMSVRINGSEYSGIAEVYVNGHWGTICNQRWDNNDANVFCKMIGFHSGKSSGYGSTTKPYLMSNFNCHGSEDSLFKCDHTVLTTSSPCNHNHAAKVTCEIGIRLVDGADRRRGRVEVSHLGQWGTICDDSWDLQDAKVVCRMLGFSSADRALGSAAYTSGSGLILLDDVNCGGSEISLLQCSTSGFGQHNCGHGEDASVICNV